ncbi:MAG: transposase family protein [Lachnospiraceae bacterium]|nr:transposase family protein [Lachnospiraceae bacterium]
MNWPSARRKRHWNHSRLSQLSECCIRIRGHYTSKAFTEFCESINITQSMSKAGCPYDNAPMERYFNTMKNECTNKKA